MTWAILYGANDSLKLEEPVDIPLGSSFEIECRVTVPTNFTRVFGDAADNNNRLLIFNSSQEVRLTDSGGNNAVFLAPSYTKTDYNTFKFTRDALGNVSFYLNDGFVSVATGFTGRIIFTLLNRSGISNYGSGSLEFLKVSINSTPELDLSPTLSDHSSTGSQPVVIDTVAGNNATGSGFPIDGSAWVDLGGGVVIEGGVNVTISKPVFTANGSASLPKPIGIISTDINKPLFSASGAVTLPNPVGVINISLSPIIFSGSGSNTLPQPIGSISTSLSKASFAVSGSASLPKPIGVVGFTIDAPTVNASGSATSATPSGSISITINKPIFIGNGTATLPNPVGIINVSVSPPTFSATGSATIPAWSASGNITLNKPLFIATGSTTLPQPSGSVELSLSKPFFNASGSVSGIVIINGTDSTVSISAQPNLLTLETKSNTITL